MKSRRPFGIAVLAALLVLVQQLALLHALSHFGERNDSVGQHRHPPASACTECLVLAGLCGAPPAPPQQIAVVTPRSACPAPLVRSVHMSVPSIYRSRGPPALA